MPKKEVYPKEGFFTPRKKKFWLTIGFIILFVGIYSLGTVMSNPYLKWVRIILLTIIGLPIMIFEFTGTTQIPFILTLLGIIAYLFYIYFLSCLVFWKRKKVTTKQ